MPSEAVSHLVANPRKPAAITTGSRGPDYRVTVRPESLSLPLPNLSGIPAGEIARDESQDDDDRLPLQLAVPIIIMLSLSSWALILTVALWLYRIRG